jgi:hypothetical protein
VHEGAQAGPLVLDAPDLQRARRLDAFDGGGDVDLLGLNEISFLASPRVTDRDILFLGNL